MSWSIAFMALYCHTHRLGCIRVCIQVQWGCFRCRNRSCIIMNIRSAHFYRVLFLSRCHLKHLSVVDESNILSCAGIVHRWLRSRQLEVKTRGTWLLRRLLQALELLMRKAIWIDVVLVFPSIQLLNGATWRWAYNVGCLVAIPLLT